MVACPALADSQAGDDMVVDEIVVADSRRGKSQDPIGPDHTLGDMAQDPLSPVHMEPDNDRDPVGPVCVGIPLGPIGLGFTQWVSVRIDRGSRGRPRWLVRTR